MVPCNQDKKVLNNIRIKLSGFESELSLSHIPEIDFSTCPSLGVNCMSDNRSYTLGIVQIMPRTFFNVFPGGSGTWFVKHKSVGLNLLGPASMVQN